MAGLGAVILALLLQTGVVAVMVLPSQTGRSRLPSIVIVGAGGTPDASLLNDWPGCLQALVDTPDGAALILLKWGNLTNYVF